MTHNAAYQDAVTRQFGRWDVAEQDAFFERGWNPETTEIILIDGEPCGYCVIETRAHDVHVRELVVHPSFQSRGVGSSILRETLEGARARAVPIVLGTFQVNRARELYERMGFREFDSNDTHVFMQWAPDVDPSSIDSL